LFDFIFKNLYNKIGLISANSKKPTRMYKGNKGDFWTERELIPLCVAIVTNKPRIVAQLIETDAVKILDSSSISYIFSFACSIGYVDVVAIFCRCFSPKVLSEGFETLFDILIKPTLSFYGLPVYPKKIHIFKLLCNQFFSDDLDNKIFVDNIQKRFYEAFHLGNLQIMNFLCSIFDKKFPPHQCYSLFYQKHMSSAFTNQYILFTNRVSVIFLLELGMSQYGSMTPTDLSNLLIPFRDRCNYSDLFNDILRFRILNSHLIERCLRVKFPLDLCTHLLCYAGIPCGASLESLQSILHYYKINLYDRF